MWFDIDLNGIRLQLLIKGYQAGTKYNLYDNWCCVDFSLTQQKLLTYQKESGSVLLSAEKKPWHNRLMTCSKIGLLRSQP